MASDTEGTTDGDIVGESMCRSAEEMEMVDSNIAKKEVGEVDAKELGEDDVTFAERLLTKQWVAQDSCDWTIFEDPADELEHHRQRSRALTRFVKAFIAIRSEVQRLRKENQHLHEIGSELQESYVRVLEEVREAVGDVAYWRELALAGDKKGCTNNSHAQTSVQEPVTMVVSQSAPELNEPLHGDNGSNLNFKPETNGMGALGRPWSAPESAPTGMSRHTPELGIATWASEVAVAAPGVVPTAAIEKNTSQGGHSSPLRLGQRVNSSGDDPSQRVEIMLEHLCQEFSAWRKAKCGISDDCQHQQKPNSPKRFSLGSPLKVQATPNRGTDPATPTSWTPAMKPRRSLYLDRPESPQRQPQQVEEQQQAIPLQKQEQHQFCSSNGLDQGKANPRARTLSPPHLGHSPKSAETKYVRSDNGMCRILFPPNTQQVPSSNASRASLGLSRLGAANSASRQRPSLGAPLRCGIGSNGTPWTGHKNTGRFSIGCKTTTATTGAVEIPTASRDAATAAGITAIPKLAAATNAVRRKGEVAKCTIATKVPSKRMPVNLGPPTRRPLALIENQRPSCQGCESAG